MFIVWLAVADARGHLMRAHVVRGLAATAGIRIDVVTTSRAGQAFLAALGTPSTLLSDHFSVVFDARQNISRSASERRLMKYLLSPSRAAADWRRLGELTRGADLVVNDLHPLLVVGGSMGGSGLSSRIVHVYGEHMWSAIERYFAPRVPAFVDRGFGAAVNGLRLRARASIEHTLDALDAGPGTTSMRHVRLFPVLALPKRDPRAVRAALGIPAGRRLAAVYLNPHFSDPSVADAIEAALDARGYAMHAVAEGFASRARFRAYDGAFADVVAASDVLVSAPGMGAVGYARMLRKPFVAMLTDQPEQRENVRFLASRDAAPHAVVDLVREPHAGAAISRALATLDLHDFVPSSHEEGVGRIASVQRQWVRVLRSFRPVHSTFNEVLAT